jgi:hypothetical protein
MLAEFFALMDERGWINTLPPDGHSLHNFCPLANTPQGSDDAVIIIEDSDDERAPKRPRTEAIISGLSRGRHVLQDVLHNSR